MSNLKKKIKIKFLPMNRKKIFLYSIIESDKSSKYFIFQISFIKYTFHEFNRLKKDSFNISSKLPSKISTLLVELFFGIIFVL